MNVAQTIPLADGWGMHGGGAGWWIVGAALMMLFMGGMMWMMMRGMGSGSPQAPSDSGDTSQSPLGILERRLAAGVISIEEYQARRDALLNGTAEPNGEHPDQQLAAQGAGEGRQR